MKKFSLAIICVFVFLQISGCNDSKNQIIYKDLMPREAKSLIEQNRSNNDFVILDIRTAGEFREGHIKDSINIDYYSSDFKSQLERLDKSKSYLVYCRSGNRSSRSLSIFKSLNFSKIYHLLNGINGWNAHGYSVVK